MMLMISVLRYRATVHPLKPAISRRKLKLACGLVYVVGFIAFYGLSSPLCLLLPQNDIRTVYRKYFLSYIIVCYYLLPTIFMTVAYFKIGQTLMKQNKYMKSICSNPVRRSAPSSSFNILTYFRNRKTFFVCLLAVLCYTVGHIPITVWGILYIAEEYRLLQKHAWFGYCADILRIAGSNSVNPLIYGTLDKKLFRFWRSSSTRRRRLQEH